MATRTDIGKIRSAIGEGRKAYSEIDYGPLLTPSIMDLDVLSSDWGNQIMDAGVFIAGIHKWADTTLRVTK